ncbi:MAG: host attachment protein [Verrucomicrobiae bacterium]|nr:host attachment protein [Verrucomicrobiae bacterium]
MNLIIVADRGGLKAFKTSKERDEKSIELLEQFVIEEMLGDFSDKMSDGAGNFPIDGTAGKGHAASEKMTIKTEHEKRAVKKLIKDLEIVLKKHQPSVWDFSASPDINGAILDHLETSLKTHLRHNLKKDLMKTPLGEMVSHFEHA